MLRNRKADTRSVTHRQLVRCLLLDMLLVAAVLALLVPAAAQARYDRAFTLSPGLHQQWPRSIRPALRLAQRVWHPACAGPLGPDHLVLDVAPVPAYLHVSRDFIGSIGGWAEQGDCRINLPQNVSLMGGPNLCETVLHEAGHVSGFHEPGGPDGGGHSANPNSIMYPASFVIKGRATIYLPGGGVRHVTQWDGVDRRCMRAYGER